MIIFSRVLLQVAHDCFGGCTGRLFATLESGACIECSACAALFTPEHFCRHTHRRQSYAPPAAAAASTSPVFSAAGTNHTRGDGGGAAACGSPSETAAALCHWGFDASNWAFYLHVDDDGSDGDENCESATGGRSRGDDGEADERRFIRFLENYRQRC